MRALPGSLFSFPKGDLVSWMQQPGVALFSGQRYGKILGWGLMLLLLLHMCLVMLGASGLPWPNIGRATAWLGPYGEATGANYQYAFFSPSIGSQIRAEFWIRDGQGRTLPVTVLSQDNREVDLRISTIFELFLSSWDGEETPGITRRMIAASLAGSVFGHYPEARSVTLHIEEYVPKSLRAPPHTATPSWKTIYSIEFSKPGKVKQP